MLQDPDREIYFVRVFMLAAATRWVAGISERVEEDEYLARAEAQRPQRREEVESSWLSVECWI